MPHFLEVWHAPKHLEFHLIDMLAFIGSGGLAPLRYRGFDTLEQLGGEFLCLDHLFGSHDLPEQVLDFDGVLFVTVTFRPNPEVRAEAEERPMDRVAGEVRLLRVMSGEMTSQRRQEALGLKHEDHFRKAYLIPALRSGLIEMTIPDKPCSSKQRYHLTAAGSQYLKQTEEKQ